MAVGKTIFAFMLLAGMAVSQAATPHSNPIPTKPLAKKSRAKKPAPVSEPAPVPQQAAPPVPLRPSQMPAVPARVSYQNNLLTIVAENSTMADVLAQLRAATGIKVETVGGPSSERIAARIGPAPVRDVILSLVQGSQYDFIILGVEGNPGAVERLILTPKMGSGGVVTASAPPPSPANGNAVYQAPQQDVSDDEGNEGFAAPQPQTQPQPGQANPNDPNAPAKTPEQLLEELRRMEEQRNNPQARPQRPPR